MARKPPDPKRLKLFERRLKRLRRLCLRLPQATEGMSYGHPAFYSGGKTFCVLEEYKGQLTICVKLDPLDARPLLVSGAAFPTPYIGARGWISLIVEAEPDWTEVQALLHQSFGLVAPAPVRELLARPVPRRTRARGDKETAG